MKSITKWVLGIVISLLIIAALVVLGYLAFNRWHFSGWMMDGRALQPWFEGRENPWRNMPMHPNLRMPGQRIGVSMAIPFLGLILRCAIPILILIALVILIINLRRPAQPVATQATYQAAVPAGPDHTCSNCGHTVQKDWSHCPYCGTEIASP